MTTKTELQGEQDARVWAKAFCERNTATDEGTMLGWFANAIEAGKGTQTKWLKEEVDALMRNAIAIGQDNPDNGDFDELLAQAWHENHLPIGS